MRVFPKSVYLRIGSCAVGLLVTVLAVCTGEPGNRPFKNPRLTVTVVDNQKKPVPGVSVDQWWYNHPTVCWCYTHDNSSECVLAPDTHGVTDARGEVVFARDTGQPETVCINWQCTSTSTDNLCQADSDCIFSGDCQTIAAGNGNAHITFTLP